MGSLVSYFVSERFDNLDEICKITAVPIQIIHGAKDTMIPVSHAKQLLENCSAPCSLIINEEMTHNDFSTSKDIIRPI